MKKKVSMDEALLILPPPPPPPRRRHPPKTTRSSSKSLKEAKLSIFQKSCIQNNQQEEEVIPKQVANNTNKDLDQRSKFHKIIIHPFQIFKRKKNNKNNRNDQDNNNNNNSNTFHNRSNYRQRFHFNSSNNNNITSTPFETSSSFETSLASLGTIDLNSFYDDNRNIYFDDYDHDDNNDDDYDNDDQYGLSTCGSAIKLEEDSNVYNKDESSTINNIENVNSVKNYTRSKNSSKNQEQSRSQKHGDKQRNVLSAKKSIANLFQVGKEYYKIGSYEDALQVQKQAYALVKHLAKHQNDDEIMCDNNSQNHQMSNNKTMLFRRQAAMIQYEIAKIKFVMYKEKMYQKPKSSSSSSTSSSSLSNVTIQLKQHGNCNTDQHLSHLFDRMQHAKCLVSLQEFAFYKDKLSKLDVYQQSTQNLNDLCLRDIISSRISLLNELAKICYKSLHKYEDALKYYYEVYELEHDILNSLTKREKDNVTCSEVEKEIDEWKFKIHQTKRKIGAIYYLNGRFDMALLSSFSQ